VNQLLVTAAIAHLYPLRYTPIGLPAVDMVLMHESQVKQLKHMRQVKLELRATAFGSQAEQLAQQALGTHLRFSGFLTNSRNGKGVVLQIQDFTPLS
jgi:primosomal replication protein N